MSVNLPTTETSTQRREREIFIAKWGWQRFNQLFPDEAACIEELNRRANSAALCLCCYKSGWHTGGITFAHAKKLRPWFAALWLYEQGIKMSACQFADFASVARPTASFMLQSVAQLAENLDFVNTDASATLATAQNLIKLSDYTPNQKLRTSGSSSVKKSKNQDDVPQQDCSELTATKNGNFNDASGSIEIKSGSAEQATSDTAKNEDIEALKQNLLNLLTDEPLTLDHLQDRIDAPGHLVTAATMLLELERAITRLADSRYVIARKEKSDSSSCKNAYTPKPKIAKQVTPPKSIFEIIKSALKEIANALVQEVSKFFGVCKDCNKRLQQKKI